jgi:hypothetical protein
MTENDQLPGQARDKCKDHQQKAVFSQDGNVMLKAPVFGTRNAFCRQNPTICQDTLGTNTT